MILLRLSISVISIVRYFAWILDYDGIRIWFIDISDSEQMRVDQSLSQIPTFHSMNQIIFQMNNWIESEYSEISHKFHLYQITSRDDWSHISPLRMSTICEKQLKSINLFIFINSGSLNCIEIGRNCFIYY